MGVIVDVCGWIWEVFEWCVVCGGGVWGFGSERARARTRDGRDVDVGVGNVGSGKGCGEIVLKDEDVVESGGGGDGGGEDGEFCGGEVARRRFGRGGARGDERVDVGECDFVVVCGVSCVEVVVVNVDVFVVVFIVEWICDVGVWEEIKERRCFGVWSRVRRIFDVLFDWFLWIVFWF